MSENTKNTGAIALIAVYLGLSYWDSYVPLVPLAAVVIYWFAVWMKKYFPTT